MPAWPGGLCPDCGVDMPPNLIHCRECRALLNSDLAPAYAEVPEFIPLRELAPGEELPEEPVVEAIEVATIGYLVGCPSCQQALKISQRYLGQAVQCNFCDMGFEFEVQSGKLPWLGVYTDCPHCAQRLRIGTGYLNIEVCCNFCQGPLVVRDESSVQAGSTS
ncbi:hypothetical protein [Lacunimicrobium album]